MRIKTFCFCKLLPILFSVFLFGCNGFKTIKNTFVTSSPYDRYVKDLENANLQERPMVKAWISAGEKALSDTVIINLPFAETGHFLSHEPEARSYRFTVKDGQVITVNGAFSTTADATIFLDLFVWKDEEWKRVSHADSSFNLTHEFNRDYQCLLRVQPELLVNAYYTIQLSLTPVLMNPVSGASNRSIQSFYGDSRDGGKRAHEGIDIFAKKGTPVIAPTTGYITRLGNTRLGGKVVWMRDKKRGHAYYFAHLDSQYVQPGRYVEQGDTLGTVGNTGNARFTPPHLHFGIYQSGSKDPLHYIKTMEDIIKNSPLDTTFHIAAYKVGKRQTTLQAGPGKKLPEKGTLKKGTYVKVLAQTKDWYRIALADDRQGYVLKKSIVPLSTGTFKNIAVETPLLSALTKDGVAVGLIRKDAGVEVLAEFNDHVYVKTKEGLEGWLAL